jgi:hypothetical protein
VVKLAWTADWLWGLPLIALTLVIHVAAIIAVAVLLTHHKLSAEQRRLGRRDTALLAIVTIGAIGLLLAVVHGLEAMVWAAAYLLLGAMDTLADAVLYSLDSMTTRGSPGLGLAGQWKLMGALESVNGVLLFGLSTAFLAAVINRLWSWIQGGADPPQPQRESP